MSTRIVFDLVVDKNAATVNDLVKHDDWRQAMEGFRRLMAGVSNGAYDGAFSIRKDADKASGTLTFDTVIATDVVTINGVDFTCQSSGATGNQFNVGANDTETAANAAAAINASATALVSDTVVASSNGAVLTITAKYPGEHGNAITIASVDSTITASGARLTGGDDGTVAQFDKGLDD